MISREPTPFVVSLSPSFGLLSLQAAEDRVGTLHGQLVIEGDGPVALVWPTT